MTKEALPAHIERERLDAMWEAAQLIHHALGHGGIRLKACPAECCYHNYTALNDEEYKLNK